jgi:PKD repeat protein
MVPAAVRRAVVVAAVAATAACTVHDTNVPPLAGPSALALTLRLTATPDVINQDGGSQSAVKVLAIGPDGRGVSALPLRLDMNVGGQPGDFGTLSARSIVTNSDGVASVVYTAPPAPPNGVFGTCLSLPGTCVTIVATPTSTNFGTVAPESVNIRLAPPGVILPPTQPPIANFTFTPAAPAANSPVQFDASTSCPSSDSSGRCTTNGRVITSYAWNFGDGSTGTGQTVGHSFALQQSYTVTLTVTNDIGASATKSQVLSIGAGSLPIPNFTFSPTSPGVGEPVFFNGLGSTPGQGHTIASYRWTFGDGASGSGATVSHAYAAAGSYAVQLTVTDDSGQSATSQAQTVTVGNPPGPTASFTFSPAQPNIGDTVVFDWRTSTTAQGQRIVSLDWNFGDSTPIVHCPGDPACTSAGITTHVFTTAGSFNVNLVVTDSAGRTNAKAQIVLVGTGNPTAVLSINKTGGNGILADGSGSTAVGSAVIASYTFNWGDGTPNTTGTAASVSHPFPAAGTYTVRLTVTDNAIPARSSSTTASVTVP